MGISKPVLQDVEGTVKLPLTFIKECAFPVIFLTFQELLRCLDVNLIWTAFLELCPVFVTLFQPMFGAIIVFAVTMNQSKVVASDIFVVVIVPNIASKTKVDENQFGRTVN